MLYHSTQNGLELNHNTSKINVFTDFGVFGLVPTQEILDPLLCNAYLANQIMHFKVKGEKKKGR